MKKFVNQTACTAVRRGGRMLLRCALMGLLAACSSKPKNLYDWQTYEPSVRAYLADEGADLTQQVQVLEENLASAQGRDVVLPPGFRAHLGMLYLKMGSVQKAAEQLQAEKLAFPEGAGFMDFLQRYLRPAGDKDQPSSTHSQEQSS